MVTILMFYCCRASPKHRYNIIEVDYGGGGHRTWLRDQEINCCVYGVPPSAVYKGVEEAADQGGWHALGGSPTPTWSRTPHFLLGEGEGRKRREGGRKGGAAPLPIRIGLGRARPLLCSSPLLSTKA